MAVLEPRRTALIVIPLVDALDEVDANADDILRGHGLDREKIRDVALRLPASVVCNLFREAEAVTADPTIGVRAGMSIRRGVLDVYDYFVGSAATLGDAWASAAHLDGLLDDTYKRSLRVHGERAVIEYHRDPGEPDGFAEFAIAMMGTIARQITGVFLDADRVTFKRKCGGADADRFGAILGHDPEFGATADALEFPSSYLSLPLRTADPGLHKILERHAEELLTRLPKLDSLSDQVRQVVLGELRGGNPGLVYVAEKLGTSARTLRRRLAEEGTTHQGLLDELRKNLADRYLHENTITVSQVALFLGFSSPSAFYRAFKRWYGTSPEHHRRR